MQEAIARICEWYTLCGDEATTTRPHPILGSVPICERCDTLIDRLDAQIASR